MNFIQAQQESYGKGNYGYITQKRNKHSPSFSFESANTLKSKVIKINLVMTKYTCTVFVVPFSDSEERKHCRCLSACDDYRFQVKQIGTAK